MPSVTIQEALAQVKTINRRIEKKRESIIQHLARPDSVRDPLEKEGGSVEFVRRERQAVGDLEEEIVRIRSAIASANYATPLKIEGQTRCVAEWLVWRREVSGAQKAFLDKIANGLAGLHQQVAQKGARMREATVTADAAPTDVVVNISEKQLAEEREQLEKILGDLDGQLSLKNATVTVTW